MTPATPDTRVSALIDERSTARVLGLGRARGRRRGRLMAGGTVEGGVLAPTVLLDVPDGCAAWDEEIFGPVVVVRSVPDLDAAFEAVNASRYGLHASVFTGSLDTAFAAIDRLEVGGVVVNEVPGFRSDVMPYGGVKDSGDRAGGAAVRDRGADRDPDGRDPAVDEEGLTMSQDSHGRRRGRLRRGCSASTGGAPSSSAPAAASAARSPCALAAQGATVVCADVDEAAAKETAASATATSRRTGWTSWTATRSRAAARGARRRGRPRVHRGDQRAQARCSTTATRSSTAWSTSTCARRSTWCGRSARGWPSAAAAASSASARSAR